MGDKPKPHVVLVPFPAQGHVAPLMQLARVLHARGFHITFVQTELHYRRLLGAKGEAAVASPAADFRVEVVPDGLSLSRPPRTLEGHLDAMARNCLEPFKRLLRALPGEPGVPPVSAVVADVAVTFAAAAARQLGLPDVQFFTASACGLMGHLQYEELIRRGLVPLKGKDYLTDGSLDTPLDWVPGMKGIRLKDMPTFCRTTDPDDALLRIHVDQMRSASSSCAIILNTFYDFEKDVLDALSASFPTIYTIGPLASLLADDAIDVSLWQEDDQCLAWLDGKEESSVVYVNFGSLAVMTAAQTRELARGLAECGLPFLWVMRPDMVDDVDKALPWGFLSDVGGRGLIVSWCPQAAVLRHPSVGLFVTHCGWNSLLEAVVGGVPVLGWPVMAEQTTNCRQASSWWGNGAELPREVESGAVARLVREMMAGRLGKEKRERAMEWKRLAEEATKDGGSSWNDIARLVDNIRLKRI